MWWDIQKVVRYETRGDKRRGDVLDMGIVLMWACARLAMFLYRIFGETTLTSYKIRNMMRYAMRWDARRGEIRNVVRNEMLWDTISAEIQVTRGHMQYNLKYNTKCAEIWSTIRDAVIKKIRWDTIYGETRDDIGYKCWDTRSNVNDLSFDQL